LIFLAARNWETLDRTNRGKIPFLELPTILLPDPGLRLLASASLAAAEDAFLFSKKRNFGSNGGELKERRGRELIVAGPVEVEQPDGSSSYLNIGDFGHQFVLKLFAQIDHPFFSTER
jgi:hypothetical protein